MRSKQEYVLNERNGKMVPEKVGLKAVQRQDVDYEFTIVLDINMKNHAVASKDRTNLFMGKPEFTITPNTGREILAWCTAPNQQLNHQTHEQYGTNGITAGQAVQQTPAAGQWQ